MWFTSRTQVLNLIGKISYNSVMTFKKAQNILQKMSYKPECRSLPYWVTIHDYSPFVIIRVRLPRPDSGNPFSAAIQPLIGTSQVFWKIFEGWTEQEFLLDLYKLVVHTETHEVSEWLRVEGKPVVDPHPELSPHRTVGSVASAPD